MILSFIHGVKLHSMRVRDTRQLFIIAASASENGIFERIDLILTDVWAPWGRLDSDSTQRVFSPFYWILNCAPAFIAFRMHKI